MAHTLILNAETTAMNVFYVYGLVDPRSDSVFYIGKGKHNRAKSHISLVRNGKIKNLSFKDKIIKKILELGLTPGIKYFSKDMLEAEALELERQLIAEYGRKYDGTGVLVNVCEGGKEVPLNSGRTRWQKGRTPWNKGLTGFKHSEETCKQMSASRKGLKNALGSKHSLESRHQRSEARKGFKFDDITRQKMSDSQKGRVFSPEHKQKLREALIRRHERERSERCHIV